MAAVLRIAPAASSGYFATLLRFQVAFSQRDLPFRMAVRVVVAWEMTRE
jgi:hypothetical protein